MKAISLLLWKVVLISCISNGKIKNGEFSCEKFDVLNTRRLSWKHECYVLNTVIINTTFSSPPKKYKVN
jgi:hypothetical protein